MNKFVPVILVLNNASIYTAVESYIQSLLGQGSSVPDWFKADLRQAVNELEFVRKNASSIVIANGGYTSLVADKLGAPLTRSITLMVMTNIMSLYWYSDQIEHSSKHQAFCESLLPQLLLGE